MILWKIVARPGVNTPQTIKCAVCMLPGRLDWCRMCFENVGRSCPWTYRYVPFQLNGAWRTTQIAARTSKHAGSPGAGVKVLSTGDPVSWL
jgi:hypothetical protein